MTTRSIFWRLFWKEYRLQRPLWIAMVLLTTFILFMIDAFVSAPQERINYLFYVATAFPALYTLGCGAMLFAGEHEAETYEFQRILPVQAKWVFLSKISLVILSTVAMFGLMWLLAASLSGWGSLNSRQQAVVWSTFGFFGVEMFVWTVLFSLLTHRVIVAAVSGVAAASASVFLLAVLIAPRPAPDMEMYLDVLVWRVNLTVIVAALDYGLALRWFWEERKPTKGAGWWGSCAAASTLVGGQAGDSSYDMRLVTPNRITMMGRLVWQHARQSITLTAVIYGVFLVPLILFAVMRLWSRDPDLSVFFPTNAAKIFFDLGTIVLLAYVPLLGLCAFHTDQWRHSYRFLADRGVSPKYVWLSRLLMALAPPVIFCVGIFGLVCTVPSFSMPDYQQVIGRSGPWRLFSMLYMDIHSTVSVLGYVILGIATGQFCSMLLRSGILAGLLSIMLTAIFVGWSSLMSLWNVNWLWSVAPIPLAMLLASRLRTSGWLIERNTMRAWQPPILAMAIPAAVILTAIPLYRVYSIPVMEPGFKISEYDRPLNEEEKTTLEMYRQTCMFYRSIQHRDTGEVTEAEKNAWVEKNQQTIERAIQLSKRKYSPLLGGPFAKHAYELAGLLIYHAERIEKKGELDAALEHYAAALKLLLQGLASYPIKRYPMETSDLALNIRSQMQVYTRLSTWAARPGQTPERLLAAERRLEELSSLDPGGDGIKVAHCYVRRFLWGDLEAIQQSNPFPPEYVPTRTLLTLHLPWERARALRLLDGTTRFLLNAVPTADAAIQRGEPFDLAPPLKRDSDPWLTRIDKPYALCYAIHLPPICYPLPEAWEDRIRTYRNIETSRRAAQLILAIRAWKLEHGALPETLEPLAGTFGDKLPVDPYTGKPFRYLPHGIPVSFSWRRPSVETIFGIVPDLNKSAGGCIDAHRPFLWSAGPKVRLTPGNEQELLKMYQIRQESDMDSYRRPSSEMDLWSSGWPFPIPE